MTKAYVAAIDQGTTSSRCMIFDAAGAVAANAQVEHRQHFPQPGWVEHDAGEIWTHVERVVSEALAKLDLVATDLAAAGITNQRETTLVWEKASGRPIANAIVWQDTRTAAAVQALGGEAGQDRFRELSGLPLATYFSGPKLAWLLDNIDGARTSAERGELLFGTMDSWLIWNLTGVHATDVTNASRTMLMNLATLDWDDTLLDAMRVPRAMLPTIAPSSGVFGIGRGVLEGVPIASALGDQQAALFGQTCFSPGEGKCTYGTGNFLLVNTGEAPVASKNGLITTVAYRIGEAPAAYALEGSIAVTGALVQWLRDNLGLIRSAPEIEALARSVETNGGCYFVPAFSGLFAPYWRADARGVIVGLTGYVNRGHIARAALEAVAWQTREVADAMAADSGHGLSVLKADGGMTANDLLMQFQADVLGAPVVRPAVAETTCLGAAYAAGLAVGFWPDLESLRGHWRADREWRPAMTAQQRDFEYAQWKKAVARTLDWAV
ncbi:MAG TPA: glycerol kinase GlpK [Caulobacteraceae bacterium]|nr:glycerol kinase GlpK [Caulobacteraceae bacterium]